jgi:hypothetical protein
MYSANKYSGDDPSVGEELLMGVSEIEERARVVDKAVREGYFTIKEALPLYKVSEIEYLAYSLLKNKKALEATSKQSQVINAVSIILNLFDEASNKFDPEVKNMMQQLETIIKEPAFQNIAPTSLPKDKKIIATIPLHFVGVAAGVKAGGKLVVKMKNIKVKALPKYIKEYIEVDVKNLRVNENIRVEDIRVDNMEIMISPRIPIASVSMTRQLKQKPDTLKTLAVVKTSVAGVKK